MYYVNNKFSDHGKEDDVVCQTAAEAEAVRAEIAEQIADLFRAKESDGEWEKLPCGRKYNAPDSDSLITLAIVATYFLAV